MHHQHMQQIIELLEQETRSAGYEYSADMLSIAAISLRKEADLSEQFSLAEQTSLDSGPVIQ